MYSLLFKRLWSSQRNWDFNSARMHSIDQIICQFQLAIILYFFWRDTPPQNDNCVIFHLPLCRSKPVKCSFVIGTQVKIFWMRTGRLVTNVCSNCFSCRAKLFSTGRTFRSPEQKLSLYQTVQRAHKKVWLFTLMCYFYFNLDFN